MSYLLNTNRFCDAILALLLGFATAALSPSESVAADADTLSFHAELVNFASDTSDLSRLDIYTRVNFDDVQFIKTPEGTFSGQYDVSASVYDDSGELVTGKTLRETVEVKSIGETASIKNYRLSKLSFTLPAGPYRVSVVLRDLETNREGDFSRQVALTDFSSSTKVMTSGLLFLEFYPRDKTGTVSYVPRLTSIRHQDSNLNAYFEVYNLPAEDSVKVEYNISDEENETHHNGAYWLKGDKEPVTPSYFEIEGADLPHGKYVTEVNIQTATETLKIEKAFDWLIEGVPLTFTFKEAIETLKYIASDSELKELKELSGKEQHAAFLEFWDEKDPDPQTTGNALRQRYYNRIKYANEHFDGLQQEGWQTDMGWVYVMLGPPDNVNRDPFMTEYPISGRANKAAEVWQYYNENRELLFVDENGFGQYRLVNPQDVYEMLR